MALAGFVAVLLTSCGSSGALTSGATDSPTTAPSTVGSSPVTSPSGSAPSGGATEAPEPLRFSAAAVGGGQIDFTSFAGTTVALWFWAPT